MVQEVILSISLIIGIAAIITIIARAIKQPPIIAYLISGIIVGPIALNLIGPETASSQPVQVFAQIGVAFLLFIIGLSLDFKILKELGKISVIAGISQIILTALLGYLIAIALGFSALPAIYLSVALAFSSTVVVVKILSDKKEMGSLHAKISLGILIVQDFIAALALILSPVIKTGQFDIILLAFGKIIGLTILIFIFSYFFLQNFLHYIARSQEVLFLFGVAWALLISTLFSTLGFSLEIGALIAGISLASSRYTLELGGKIKPLRDFFIVLFFVFFGSQLIGPITPQLIKQAIFLSIFVIVGKPLIVMGLMRVLGYKKRTNFLIGSSLAQISEFSLVLILIGFKLGHISQELMNLCVIIALVTIGTSSYTMYHSHSIFNSISHLLSIFEGKANKEHAHSHNYKSKTFNIIIFGHHRMGYKLAQILKKQKESFLIVDYNPRTIMELAKENIPAIYGDANDAELLEELNLDKVKLVISTIPEETSNILIKKHLTKVNSQAAFIATAEYIPEAIDLYKEGVDFVLLPHLLGGTYAAELIEKNKFNKEKYKEAAKKQKSELKERKE